MPGKAAGKTRGSLRGGSEGGDSGRWMSRRRGEVSLDHRSGRGVPGVGTIAGDLGRVSPENRGLGQKSKMRGSNVLQAKGEEKLATQNKDSVME